MAIAECISGVDSSQRELVQHGTPAFPVACYFDDLSNYEVQWHWHEELEAAIILEGTALIAAGNEKYILRAGEGFFVNSQILHGCWDLEGSCSKFHSIVFHPRLVGGSLDSQLYQTYVLPLTENHAMESLHMKPDIPWQKEFLSRIEAAWQACSQEGTGYEFQVRNALSDLILLLHRNSPDARNQPSSKQQRDSDRIKAMLQYIHEHSTDEVTTRAIAQAAAISESECLRCFRSTIGTTPIQYVRQYRIQKATELLTATQLPVSAISEQCGFQDVSYFTKTFRVIKGCAPTVFRKK